jgi:glutaconate CoA-transferase subunit A
VTGEAPLSSLAELAARVPDGAKLAVPRDITGPAMAATRALIRRGVRNLHLVCVPTSGLQADLLIGAGCVATLETSAVTLGEFGPAPRFTAAVKAGSIAILDATCPAIHAGLQAAEKGIPFMPLRGVLGSDLVAHRPDWRVIQNPFAEAPGGSEAGAGGGTDGGGDPILVLPAIRPDVALFHAPRADRFGNVWIGPRRELMTMAHAARETLVTVEEVIEGDLLAEDEAAAGTIPALYVSAIAETKSGAWPLAFHDAYAADAAELADYVKLARTEAGFAQYLARYLDRGDSISAAQ